MSGQWKLRTSNQCSPIGEFKGAFEDYYRTIRTDKEELKEIRYVNYNKETILVYYPIAVAVQDQFIYACEVIWRESGKKDIIDSKRVFIGDIDESLLKNDRNYFICLMGILLKSQRIKKYIEAFEPNNKKGIYIGSVKEIKREYRKYMDKNMMIECAQTKDLFKKQEILNNIIEEYNQQIYERPDYRGRKR